MSDSRKPRLAVTLGDVRGIGPEIIEKAAASREVRTAADLVLVGPRGAVVHDGQAYVMPPESVGLTGALYLFPDRVTVIVGRYQSTHPRHPMARSVDSVSAPPAAHPSGTSWGPRLAVPLAARGV